MLFRSGIVSVRDAAICAEAGCAGIIISHHQNMFPWTVPPLLALREIRKEVGNTLKILIDSNFETGYDVFKALALGADGVFVARPLVPIFRELLDVAAEYGITLCLENVSWCFFHAPAFGAELKARLGDHRLKFVLDIKQAVRSGEDPFAFVEAVGEDLENWHLCDYAFDDAGKLSRFLDYKPQNWSEKWQWERQKALWLKHYLSD